MEGQLLINTYCDRPWTELHIEEDGSITPCCVMPSNRFPMGNNLEEYLKGKPLQDLKKALSSGKQHSNCEWCWNNEKNNLKTHRISESRGVGIKSIHIRLSNVCNFKCRICNPSFSSTWAQENKKHKYFVFEDNKITKDAVDQNGNLLFKLLKSSIESGTLQQLSISGGEPLITDSHYRLLSFLIDNRLTNITLGYSTNLSNLDFKGIDLLSLWKEFKEVNLEASVDGWGAHVEYSRTGFKCNTFLENFKKAFKYIDAINCVVNIYSVWTLPFIEKFRKHGINIIYSPCYLPIHTNPQLLLRKDKEKLFELYQDFPALVDVYKNFIDTDLENGYTIKENLNDIEEHLSLSEIRDRMIKYNLLLDSHRNTSFFDVFPMYKKYSRS